MRYILQLLFLIVFNVLNCYSQSFLNGDLEGIVTNGNDLPSGWLNVPYSDYNCYATQDGFDSPDLTNLIGPNSTSGINGNPYSGKAFVSGMRGGNSIFFWQEGIMQIVKDFDPGLMYLITFRQTVVKQVNCLDNSG
jgi:hypothetical protein